MGGSRIKGERGGDGISYPRLVELLLLLGPYSAWRGEVVMAGVYSDGGLPHISIPLLYSTPRWGGEGMGGELGEGWYLEELKLHMN